MERKTVNFKQTFTDAIQLGTVNLIPLILASLLLLVTFWIPYFGLGALIGYAMLPLQLQKNKTFNPTCIFDAKWRHNMGEYMLCNAMLGLPTAMGIFFGIIPGIVLGLSWMLATFILFSTGKNPLDAIMASNKATMGSKWTIFLVYVVFGILTFLVTLIATGLLNLGIFGLILFIIVTLLLWAIQLSLQTSIWNQLRDNVE